MNADNGTDSSIDDSGLEGSEANPYDAPKKNGFTFGPTEVSIIPTPPEEWSPAKRAAAMVIGATAIIVGICGLLGIQLAPRHRDWRDDR